MSSAKKAASIEERKKKNKKILIIACVIVAVVILVGLSVVSLLSDRGVFLRAHTCLETEHFKVDDAMMGYFTYLYYMNFYNTYGAYASSFGLTPGYPLSGQSPNGASETWLQYFARMSTEDVTGLLVYAEAAHEEGLTLTDEMRADIEEEITNFKTSCQESGHTISSLFANVLGLSGINENDIRRGMEITTLATKKQEDLLNAHTYTDEEIDAYYNEHKTSFTRVDYMTYEVKSDLTKVDQTSETFEEDLQALYAETKASAEELSRTGTEEAFKAWITAAMEGSAQTDIDKALTNATKTNVSYTEDDTTSEKLFATAAGEGFVIDSGTDGNYVVYLVTKAAYRNEKPYDADILLLTFGKDDEEKANSALATLTENGATEEAFASLAASLEVEDFKHEGVLYSDTTLDSAVIDYAFGEETVKGAYALLPLEDSEGFALVLVTRINEKPVWKTSVDNTLKSEAISEIYKGYQEKYTVTNHGFKF